MKEKIIEEAERLFWKYGVRTITMDDIARRLAISKKTIYQHFIDKEDIVFHVVKYHIENEVDEVCQLNAVAGNPIEELMLVSDMMRRHADEINPSVMLDIQRYYPKAWGVFLEYKENQIIKDIISNLRRGVEEGLYRPDIDLETMARLRVELLQIGFDEQIFPHHKDMYVVQDQLHHHFVRGILTLKGFEIYNNLKQRSERVQPIIYENK
ncbi:TetR/AcrR family transcriptional regulator [Rudanella lutea]|uniref:TetR/AcrR family transcriptional regulator n=1 Tax=Rudanella lutea TaxID=451374 RepID=UPI00036446A5|nr:TetR/AcrR family transcriptional regulator [Rudanella lutea]